MGMIFRPDHDQFASDVMVEADAEMALDSRPVLPRIRVPVLLIGGDKDFYIPVARYHETARLIPDCTLKIYEGESHVGAIRSRRLAPDILDFIKRKPAVAT